LPARRVDDGLHARRQLPHLVGGDLPSTAANQEHRLEDGLELVARRALGVLHFS